MWKTTLAYTLLASNALAQQQVLGDVANAVPGSLLASSREPAINMGVRALVQKLMRQANIQGLSLGVVHPDNSVETASWGIRAESGEGMTTDVSCIGS